MGVAMKAWQGRFKESTHALMEAFNESISFDQTLIDEDIEGSIAHVMMLEKIHVLSKNEKETIIETLKEIQNDYHHGIVEFSVADEDIHMAIENELTKRIGSTAKKMHTARSRNDQVATDLRLYAKKKVLKVIENLEDLLMTLLDLSEKHLDTIMPGFTHLQKAQPILLSYYLNAYGHMFSRDIERLKDAYKRIDILPLGSGALAGCNYPSDREFMAEVLNFKLVSSNGLDAISDRDFIIELQSAFSIIMVHFSRLSEDLIIWNSESFSYITLSDQFATGSSLMPQKKNPDACELARGKSGRVFGNLMSILTVMKGIPMSYNKDMQEDKEGFFDSVKTIMMVSSVMIEMLKTISFHKDQMREDATNGFLNATDLADYLVKNNIPFREAHHLTGTMVKHCQENKKKLEDLTLEEMKEFSSQIDQDIYQFLELSVDSKQSSGSTNRDEVKKDLECLRSTVKKV